MAETRRIRRKAAGSAPKKYPETRSALPRGATVHPRKAGSPQKPAVRNARRQGAPVAGGRVLVFLTLALCAAIAVQLGVFEQDYAFQKSPALVFSDPPNWPASPALAFAESDSITMPASFGKTATSNAVIAGAGEAAAVKAGVSSQDNIEILSISINGQAICEPCINNAPYPLAVAQEGALHVAVKTGPKPPGGEAPEKSRLNIAFIDNIFTTAIQPEVSLQVAGGWKSTPNSQIPSSVYGTDAPFHLNRVRILPGYLAKLQWPYANYTFLSALPPSLLNLFFGTPPEYAYKLWQIALFFLPVAIFYLFSRKLPSGRNAVFALSSLLYLCLPVTGLLIGGGPDLFMYGMTAQTFATCLSLVFFYFAYEYAAERKRNSLLYAALFFMLAFLSNQRIIVALGFLSFAASAPAIIRMDFKRVAILALCLLCAVLWNALPFALALDTGSYGTLGGAAIHGEGTWAVAALQSGFVVLPLLFIAGVWEAHRNRDLRAILLAAGAFMALLFTTSPGVNRLFPFVDGIRFLPSFFLPAFFLAGMGAYSLWKLFAGAYERALAKRKWDRDTYGGAIALAVMLPAAAVFFAVAATSVDFYAHAINSQSIAEDYVSQQQAYAIIGSERAFFIAESKDSQYPVYEPYLQNTYDVDFAPPSSLAQMMQSYRVRYAILGSAKHALERDSAGTASRHDEYLELKDDPRFEEIAIGGPDRLFLLKDGENGSAFFAQGAAIADYSVSFDRARFEGVCHAAQCSLVFFAGVPENNECAVSGARCTAAVDADKRMVSVQGIPQGSFELEVTPKNQDFVLPLAAISALAIGACYVFSKES